MSQRSPDHIGMDDVYLGGQVPHKKQHEKQHQQHQQKQQQQQQQQQQQRRQGAGFSSKQMLDAYIYDFFSKSSLKNTAATFCREGGLVDVNGVAKTPSVLDEVKDAPQGFLYEWWQIFWDLFNARTHKEGSAVAKEYTKILSDKQKQEYAYRSHAVQAARLQRMAGQNGESPVESGLSPFVSPMPGMHYPPNYVNVPNPYVTHELNQDVHDFNVTAPTQFVPPVMGADASGWPVNPNHQFPTNALYHNRTNHYYAVPPTHSPSPQPIGSRSKPSRPPLAKNNSITDIPGSPVQGSPAGSYRGSSSSFAGRISVIEGLHNYQRQMIMSEIEYNNQNKKTTPSPGTSNGTTSKKRMLPPSAGILPQNGTPTSASCSSLNMMNAAKPKAVRRRSANSTLGPVSRSMQPSFSDSPSTPVNAAHPINVNEVNERLVLPNSLATVSEAVSSSGSELTDSSKKSSKKVRKPKKALAITFSNNGFSFVPPNSVPTPPNEAQQKAQFRVLGKYQAKKSQANRSSSKSAKGSSNGSPQVMGDESSMSTPTFVNTMWNSNGKVQTTPHTNFTFVGENGDISGGGPSGPPNADSALGSSSGGSYQYNETDADELLSINSMLSMPDVTAIKGEDAPNDLIPGTDTTNGLTETAHQDFNLDLLEPGEPSFNFLSPRQ